MDEASLRKWFKDNEDAVVWALSVWDVIQFWDDLYDGDEELDAGESINHSRLNRIMTMVLCIMPTNLFFRDNVDSLSPVLLQCVLMWETSNTMERAKDQDSINKAYVLRASYYQLLVHIAYLTGGFEWANEISGEIWSMYGEKLNEYNLEVQNA
jgi:hypothetical protein